MIRRRLWSAAGSLAIAVVLVLIARSRLIEEALMAAQAELDEEAELAALVLRPASIVHRCPPQGGSVTPCCGLPPLELSRTDRITVDASQVTCTGRRF